MNIINILYYPSISVQLSVFKIFRVVKLLSESSQEQFFHSANKLCTLPVTLHSLPNPQLYANIIYF